MLVREDIALAVSRDRCEAVVFIDGSDKAKNPKYATGLRCRPLKEKEDITARNPGTLSVCPCDIPRGRRE